MVMDDPICQCGHSASRHVLEPPETAVDPTIDAPEENLDVGKACTVEGCTCPGFTPK